MIDDLISRQAAIDALWKALYEYEDETEKQFLESEELDIATWFLHRIFVQNMNVIDRRTILDLPSAQLERKKGKWIKVEDNPYRCSVCGELSCCLSNYCPDCGADMRKEGESK